MAVFLMFFIIFIMLKFLDTWLCMQQSLVEQVIFQQNLSIAMGHLADTQRFGKQLPFCLADQWKTKRYIFIRNYIFLGVRLGEISSSSGMLSRFLYISTKGLIAIFGKHGFLTDVGQSLEVTRVRLNTVPLVLPSHFIIIIISAIETSCQKNIKPIC